MKFNIWINKTLSNMNIKNLNKIQTEVCNIFDTNKNIIGISNTGSGKTLSFLLPILNNINFEKNYLQAIIICPTKELARQINQIILEFKKNNTQLNSKLIIGGNDILNKINNNFQIIVATPNKLFEFINTKASIFDFSKLNYLVLDEADMLLDLGFFSIIENIISYFINKNEKIKLMAFSATFHELLSNKLKKYFTNTEIINLSSKIDHNKNISHNIIYNHDKYHSLSVLLNTINPYFCLIFANTTKEVDMIFSYLKKQDRNVIKIHSNLSDRERKNAYNNIKKNKYTYVVCSDLLSRGMDIDGASHVINWNLPNEIEWYFHRSGRTGRNKYEGYSYILLQNENDQIINKLLKHKIIFNYYKIKNNNLFKIKDIKFNKNIINDEQKNEIKKVLAKKVAKKPGYKKKIKLEIENIKNKYKRQKIEQNVKKQLMIKYKNNQNK